MKIFKKRLEIRENKLLIGRIDTNVVCYKKKMPENTKIFGHLQANIYYSHSIVPMGFGVRSYRTLLIPATSLVMRAVIWWRMA